MTLTFTRRRLESVRCVRFTPLERRKHARRSLTCRCHLRENSRKTRTCSGQTCLPVLVFEVVPIVVLDEKIIVVMHLNEKTMAQQPFRALESFLEHVRLAIARRLVQRRSYWVWFCVIANEVIVEWNGIGVLSESFLQSRVIGSVLKCLLIELRQGSLSNRRTIVERRIVSAGLLRYISVR